MESPRPQGIVAAGGKVLHRLRASARRPRPLSPGLALLQFSLSGVLALLVLAVVGLNALQGVAERQAVHAAADFSLAEARQEIAAAVMAGVLSGDEASLSALDRIVRSRLLSNRVLRVKLVDASGRVLYSDEGRYIGHSYGLTPKERKTLAGGPPDGEVSDLTAPDHVYDRFPGVHEVLQVYAPVRGPGGQPLMLELLVRADDLNEVALSAARAELPAVLLALLALQVLQLPLALGLVRRVQQGQRERDALHHHALEARDHERRQIARDLHDGVVQQLAGVSYSLASVGAGASDVPEDVLGVVRSAAATTRDSALELRTLVAELTPPTVYEVGLARALEDLVASLDDAGTIRAELEVQPGFSAQPDAAGALFRAAQEALRNVVKHARASSVLVRLEREGRLVRVVVRDDGQGLPSPRTADGDGHHFGLRLLAETAREVGGRMDVSSEPAGGTTFLFELPDR